MSQDREITHSERNIWNGPIVATAFSRKKRKPGRWLVVKRLQTTPSAPGHPGHQTWQCVILSCVVLSRTMFTYRQFQRHYRNCERAYQHRNWERHTRLAWEGLVGMGVSPVHLPCHTGGAHRMHLRSLWKCKHSSFKWWQHHVFMFSILKIWFCKILR